MASSSAAAHQIDHDPSGGSCRGASAKFAKRSAALQEPASIAVRQFSPAPHKVSRSALADDDSCLLQAELALMDSAGTPACLSAGLRDIACAHRSPSSTIHHSLDFHAGGCFILKN